MADLPRIARQLRQRIELHRLAGWEVSLRKANLAPRPAAPESIPPRSSASESPGSQDVASVAGTCDRDREPAAERARREALLEPLRAEVASCTRCVLCQQRTQTVFGTGDPTTRVLFVGEGPGYDEDQAGEPFVGKAGRLLNDIIKAMGLRREQVYIANVVKCRPPGNRAPDAAEMGTCGGYLEKQIGIISPEVVVALGRVAAQYLLRSQLPMGRLRGRFHDYRGIPLMPTYHPAYLLRTPSEKRKTWDDIQLVMGRLGLERPSRGPEG